MKISYDNSQGQHFDLIAGNFVKIKTANFHNWQYMHQAAAVQFGEKLQRFTKQALQYSVEVYVTGGKWEREAFLRALHEAAAHDLYKKKPGVLKWGGWCLDGYFDSSSTYPHQSRPNTTVNELRFYAPNPYWYRWEEYHLEDEEVVSTDGLDFPFDFPFDFAEQVSHEQVITVNHYKPSAFIMTINAPAASPCVTIGEHPYQVYTNVPYGSLVINSIDNTVQLNGVSVFDKRRKDRSIFQPIPVGQVQVIRNGAFTVDLKVRIERNEPTIWN